MSEAILQYPFRPRASAIPLRLVGDGRLTRLASEGDERAYTAIYDRHAQGLYRYCLSLLHNSEDASDAVQGTMMKALLALSAKRPEVPLKPWLFRIAHNEAISVQRRRRAHAEIDDEAAGLGPGADEEWADQGELRQLVEDLLALPERQRAALVMRELNGLEYEEIGVSFGTSAAAAKQTVYEARAGLFERAKGRELECGRVRAALSAGDRRALRGRRIDAHLRSCAGCTEFQQNMEQRTEAFGALAPALPGLGGLGLLKALLGGGGGGGGGSSGGGLIAGVSGGGSALGSAAALKPVAALAVMLLATSAAPIPHTGGDAEGASPPFGTALPRTPAGPTGHVPLSLRPVLAHDPFGPASPIARDVPFPLDVEPSPVVPSLGPAEPAPPTLPATHPSVEPDEPPKVHHPQTGEPSDLASVPPAGSEPTPSVPPPMQPVRPEGGLNAEGDKDNGRHLAQGHENGPGGSEQKDNGRHLAQGHEKRAAGPGEKDNRRNLALGRSADEAAASPSDELPE